jgi:protein involved in polysaccharide export with SLBB domain
MKSISRVLARPVALVALALMLAGGVAHRAGAQDPPAKAPPAPAAAAVPPVYRIGPEDVLSVAVYDEADLSGKYAVELDGTFTFP